MVFKVFNFFVTYLDLTSYHNLIIRITIVERQPYNELDKLHHMAMASTYIM